MNQIDHYEKAEFYLAMAGSVASRSSSEVSSERIVALVSIAEAHLKMIPLAPMAPVKRPA